MDSANATIPRALKWWRWLFIALETLVLAVFYCPFVVGLVSPPTRFDLGYGIVTNGLVALALLAWLFLLIVSPFFLKSLRWVALTGWLIAFGVFFLDRLTR